MNNTLHTPGPWLRSKSGNQFQIVAGSDLNCEPNELVATIHPIAHNCEYEPCDETKNNARLIASAPDLLSALEGLLKIAEKQLNQFSTHEGILNCQALANARAAIRKAKGEA
jgi:hypothetical protein